MASTSVVAVVKVPPIIIVLDRGMNFVSNLFRRRKCLETLKTLILDYYTLINEIDKGSSTSENIVVSCDPI